MALTACTLHSVKPLQIQSQLPLPALAVEYETTVISSDDAGQAPQVYLWRFYRAANRVETHNLHDNSGEIWSRSAYGNISYQRVFHAQQAIIDYLPGDLKAIGAKIDWLALSTLLDSDLIASLISDSQDTFMGRSAIHYKNSDPGRSIEILWLEQEQLPAIIRRTEQKQTVISRISAIHALHQSPWALPLSSDYQLIDFADLGDKENDAFIRQILPKLKAGYGHTH